MKKVLLFILASVFVFSNNRLIDVYAYDLPLHIRVGLTYKFKEAESVPVTNQSISIGYESGGQFFESAVLSPALSFSMTYTNLYYLKTEQAYPDYNSAKEAAYIMETVTQYKAVPCLTGTNAWAVYIGGFSNEAEAAEANNKIAEASSVVKSNGRRTSLLDGTSAVMLFDSQDFYPQIRGISGETIKLGDRSFRGRIEFGRYSGGKVTAVNVAAMNEYLYSVVPSEMPSSWHSEALKSQACAARNYAVAGIGKHRNEGYDLCDSIHCQVYLGAGNEAESTTQAVNATEGVMILYDGKPIEAGFFSSSGGMTDNSENVWTNSLPYLRSVKEVNETMAKQWTRVITLAELDKVLSANNANIGSATGMYIGSYNNAGRVGELIITGTKGNKSLQKEDIRTYFSSLSGGSLESRNFSLSTGTAFGDFSNVYITNGFQTVQSPVSAISVTSDGNTLNTLSALLGNITVIGSGGTTAYSQTAAVTQPPNTSGGTDIIITGKGWGHGVGLSQFGAKGMAELGYTYDQILKYYYTGVEVR